MWLEPALLLKVPLPSSTYYQLWNNTLFSNVVVLLWYVLLNIYIILHMFMYEVQYCWHSRSHSVHTFSATLCLWSKDTGGTVTQKNSSIQVTRLLKDMIVPLSFFQSWLCIWPPLLSSETYMYEDLHVYAYFEFLVNVSQLIPHVTIYLPSDL